MAAESKKELAPGLPKHEQPRDFSQERDDVVVPLAREVIKILASKEDLMIGSIEDTETNKETVINYYADMYVKDVAPLLLEKNARIDHMKYLFTLAVQAPALLKAHMDDTEGLDAICIPIAKKILKFLASQEDLNIGSVGKDPKEMKEYYRNMYENAIIPIIKESTDRLDYAGYIIELVEQGINFLKDRTVLTLEFHYNNATAVKWGVKDTEEIGLKDIDEALKSQAKK